MVSALKPIAPNGVSFELATLLIFGYSVINACETTGDPDDGVSLIYGYAHLVRAFGFCIDFEMRHVGRSQRAVMDSLFWLFRSRH